jgi:hypothetical protein
VGVQVYKRVICVTPSAEGVLGFHPSNATLKHEEIEEWGIPSLIVAEVKKSDTVFCRHNGEFPGVSL